MPNHHPQAKVDDGYDLIEDDEEEDKPPAPAAAAAAPVVPVGRGRGSTLPSWMTEPQDKKSDGPKAKKSKKEKKEKKRKKEKKVSFKSHLRGFHPGSRTPTRTQPPPNLNANPNANRTLRIKRTRNRRNRKRSTRRSRRRAATATVTAAVAVTAGATATSRTWDLATLEAEVGIESERGKWRARADGACCGSPQLQCGLGLVVRTARALSTRARGHATWYVRASVGTYTGAPWAWPSGLARTDSEGNRRARRFTRFTRPALASAVKTLQVRHGACPSKTLPRI